MKRRCFTWALVALFFVAVFGAPPCFAADKIKIARIGFVGDMTGPSGVYGMPLVHAHQYAIDYLNKVLYPNGMPIGKDLYHFELVIEDDRGKIGEAPAAGQRALDAGIFVLSTDLGAFLEPIYGKLAEMKVPLVTHSPFMTEKLDDPWIFRYRNTPAQVMPAVAAYLRNKFGVKRAEVLSEAGPLGTRGGQQWVDSLVRAGIPKGEIEWQQYNYPVSESQFLPYLTKVMVRKADLIVQGTTGEGSGTAQGCAMYLQSKGLGYKGYFGSYTGMTDVQARKILGADYASYLGRVYQGEGVDAFTNPDPKIRQWGREFFEKYGDYPIDLVPWAWDEIMILAQAAQMAGTVTDGEKVRQALAEMPFKFPLSSQLKTPVYPQRTNKLWDAKGQARMEVIVCGWTKEGIKMPVAFMVVDETTMKILKTTYPKSDLIKYLTQEWQDRNKK